MQLTFNQKIRACAPSIERGKDKKSNALYIEKTIILCQKDDPKVPNQFRYSDRENAETQQPVSKAFPIKGVTKAKSQVGVTLTLF